MPLTIPGIPTEIVHLFELDAKEGLESGMVKKRSRSWDRVPAEDRQAMRTKIYDSIKLYHPEELGKYPVMGQDKESFGDGIYKLCCYVYIGRYRSIYEYKVGDILYIEKMQQLACAYLTNRRRSLSPIWSKNRLPSPPIAAVACKYPHFRTNN